MCNFVILLLSHWNKGQAGCGGQLGMARKVRAGLGNGNARSKKDSLKTLSE